MLAVVACILFVLEAFGVHIGHVSLGWLGLAVLALHFVVPIRWGPFPR